MRRALAIAGLVTSALAAVPGHAAKPSTEELLESWHQANGLCRGGSGDEPMAWCAVRDGIDEVLSIRGWCYGKQGQAGFESQLQSSGTGGGGSRLDLV
jgi:hypothetical protein